MSPQMAAQRAPQIAPHMSPNTTLSKGSAPKESHITILHAVLHQNANIQSAGDSILDCCKEKTVGGVEYQLKGLADTKQFGCRNSCTFQRKDDPSTTFCFAQGDSAASCNDEEGKKVWIRPIKCSDL